MIVTAGRKHDRAGILDALLQSKGEVTNVEIAKRFGCTPMTVSDVKHQYAHLFPSSAFRRTRAAMDEAPLVPVALDAPEGATHQTVYGFYKAQGERVYRWASTEWVLSTLSISELKRADYQLNAANKPKG